MWCPEEEKKEKREEKSMPALFMEINRQYGMRCMQRIREIGIQQGQMPIIMIVYRHNGCSQKEIAEWMGVTPPTVNVSIQRLGNTYCYEFRFIDCHITYRWSLQGKNRATR